MLRLTFCWQHFSLPLQLNLLHEHQRQGKNHDGKRCRQRH